MEKRISENDMEYEYNKEKIRKIIQTVRGRIRLYPVNINHIKKYIGIDTENDSDEKIYKHEKYDMARRNAETEFLVKELGFKENEVRIKDCKMANNPESVIL